MDLQHRLAEKLALIFLDEKDDEKEKAIITYGIEVVLNELLKSILIIILGIVFGKLLVAIIGIIYLLSIRRFLGGGHFDSNIMCTVVTVFTAFIGPVLIMMIRIPLFIQMAVGVILILTIIFMNVFSEGDTISQDKKKKGRIISIIVFLVAGILAYIFGGLEYLSEIIFIEIIVVLFAVIEVSNSKKEMQSN